LPEFFTTVTGFLTHSANPPSFVSLAQSIENGLGRTHPMGWMTLEQFHCLINCSSDPDNCISEQLILDTAKRLVSGGYRDAGYTYMSIYDCWS
jgi:hypothetical protein